MRSTRAIHVVSCHAEGEVGDVIIGGVAPPPGDTLWEQSRWVERDDVLRQFMLNEPRGGVFRHVNLLVPAKHPDARMGWIIMEPADVPPMSGSNSMCVATVLLDTGILPMTEPVTRLKLEAPGGIIEVIAQCRDGKVQSVEIVNVPSFADRLDAWLEVPGLGSLRVDTAYGGDSFAIVDAQRLGFSLKADEAADLVKVGLQITEAANEQIGFTHPLNSGWNHISFCQMAGPLQRDEQDLHARNAVVIRPGKIDRSPCGTGCSARMAVMHAKGLLRVGEAFTSHSIIGSRFHCKIHSQATVAGRTAVIPGVSGRAWITGIHQHLLDPADPWPQGYRLSDTWPNGLK